MIGAGPAAGSGVGGQVSEDARPLLSELEVSAFSWGPGRTGSAPARCPSVPRCPTDLLRDSGAAGLCSWPAAMENAPECTPSPAEFTQPPSSASLAEVAPPGDSCAQPLDTVPKKLCGYLSKFGGKGPIKGWKYRWFFYDESKCHLYYSRTAQDANPLDSIDLSSAVFDCKANAEDEGTFEVKTPNRVITLKVNGTFPLFSSPSEFSGPMHGQSTLTRAVIATVVFRAWSFLTEPSHHFLIAFSQARVKRLILWIKKLNHRENGMSQTGHLQRCDSLLKYSSAVSKLYFAGS